MKEVDGILDIMETILITGGTGMIGTALTRLLLGNGYRVIILSRNPKPTQGNLSYGVWDINKPYIDMDAIKQADHIVHLAGAGVADKRWTKKRKQEIVNSRVNGSKLIVDALRDTENKVQTVVSASGIGWYGPDRKGQKPFVETDPAYTDFLGETCAAWEAGIQAVSQLGKRLTIFRTAIVLSNGGGAYKEFVRPMKVGIAGIIGSGKQMVSWIHEADICRMYLAAIENKYINGIYNAAAPDPVTNKKLILEIARARRRPFIPVHVPVFALKLALGEMSVEVLKSTTVDVTKIRDSGFSFLYPSISSAVNALAKAY